MFQSLSRVPLFATPWTVVHQAPLSMGFSTQEYWRGLPLSPPGDLPDPGIKPGSLALQAKSLLPEPLGKQAMNSMPTSKTNTNLHPKNLSTSHLMLHVTLSYDHLSPAPLCPSYCLENVACHIMLSSYLVPGITIGTLYFI